MERERPSPFQMVKYELLYDVNRIFIGDVTRIFVKDTIDFNHLRWDEKLGYLSGIFREVCGV